jgi:hydroxymethylglutaryl-CoA lyase
VQVRVTDVVLRDGIQDEPYVVSTDDKLRVAEALMAAGVPELELASFVHPKRVPQMADAENLLAALPRRPDVRISAIALNFRGAQRAAATHLDELRLVVSASAGHSQANAGRSIEEALDDVAATVEQMPQLPVVGAVATAFVSQDEGRIPPERLVSIVQRFRDAGIRFVGLADTLGTATPDEVAHSVGMVRDAAPEVEIGLHLHDPYGKALPTVDAALNLGVRRFDSAIGGFGGCPAIDDPHGNMATEVLVRHLHQQGVETGIDESALVDALRLLHEAIARASLLPSGEPAADRTPMP